MTRKNKLLLITILLGLIPTSILAGIKIRKQYQRYLCGRNLRGLAQAQTVYANDYDHEYAVQSGPGSDFKAVKWTDPQDTNEMSVGASLYLLVKEADAEPKSFTSPSEPNSQTPAETDMPELWDFQDTINQKNTEPNLL